MRKGWRVGIVWGRGVWCFLGFSGLLQWRFGLLGTKLVVVLVDIEAGHQRLGPDATDWDCNLGVNGFQKNLNLELIFRL